MFSGPISVYQKVTHVMATMTAEMGLTNIQRTQTAVSFYIFRSVFYKLVHIRKTENAVGFYIFVFFIRKEKEML